MCWQSWERKNQLRASFIILFVMFAILYLIIPSCKDHSNPVVCNLRHWPERSKMTFVTSIKIQEFCIIIKQHFPSLLNTPSSLVFSITLFWIFNRTTFYLPFWKFCFFAFLIKNWMNRKRSSANASGNVTSIKVGLPINWYLTIVK